MEKPKIGAYLRAKAWCWSRQEAFRRFRRRYPMHKDADNPGLMISETFKSLAFLLGHACLEQQKVQQNPTLYEPREAIVVDRKVKKLKKDWEKAKALAIRAYPQIKDDIPHFSDFEPLKSCRSAGYIMSQKPSMGFRGNAI